MAILLALGLWLLLRLSEGTPIGRALHRFLVERPAERLSRVSRGQVLLMLTLAGIAVTLVWLLEDDGRMLVAFGLPDFAGLAVAIDLGTLLDVTLAAVIVTSTIRLRGVAIRLRTAATARRPRPRSRRPRRLRPPANDDEDRSALAA